MEIRALKDHAYDSSWPRRALIRAGRWSGGRDARRQERCE